MSAPPALSRGLRTAGLGTLIGAIILILRGLLPKMAALVGSPADRVGDSVVLHSGRRAEFILQRSAWRRHQCRGCGEDGGGEVIDGKHRFVTPAQAGARGLRSAPE